MFNSGKSSRDETAKEDPENVEKKEIKEKHSKEKHSKEMKKKRHNGISVGTVASIPNFSNIRSKVNSKENRHYKPSVGK
jgi:hypothetical protein